METLRGKTVASAGVWMITFSFAQKTEMSRKWGKALAPQSPTPNDVLPPANVQLLKVPQPRSNSAHLLGAKYSNTWASGERFSFKPPYYLLTAWLTLKHTLILFLTRRQRGFLHLDWSSSWQWMQTYVMPCEIVFFCTLWRCVFAKVPSDWFNK